MKILITGGLSAQAQKMLSVLAENIIVLADYGDVPLFPSAKYQFISLGERNDDIISHNLLNHCLNEAVDAILPLYAFELAEVAKSAVLFEEFNIRVLTPEAAQVIPLKK